MADPLQCIQDRFVCILPAASVLPACVDVIAVRVDDVFIPGLFLFIYCGWSLLNHGAAQRMRLNLGNLNPIYERELIKLGVYQKVEGS